MWVLFLILMCGTVNADVFVLTAPDKSVVGISEQNDIVIPQGYKLNIVKNKRLSDLTVSMGQEKLYDFDNGSFRLNSQRVQDKNKDDSDKILNKQKRDNDKQSAIVKLKNLGLTDDELGAIIK